MDVGMRMRLPDQLRINGLDYAVNAVESLDDNGQLCNGKIWPGRGLIEINIGEQTGAIMLVSADNLDELVAK